MARSVVERLKLILVDVGKMSDEQAEAYVKQMTVKKFVLFFCSLILSFVFFYFFKKGVLQNTRGAVRCLIN